MKIGIDLGSHFIKASRLSLEGFPMTIQDSYSKVNYSTNRLEKTENGFLIGYDHLAVSSSQKINLLLSEMPKNQVYFTDKTDTSWHTETLIALMLKKIKADIDTIRVESINFAIPVGLGEAQKAVFNNAALLADISQISLIEAPLAVVAYHKIQYLNTILIIDWGYSGLKITIVKKEQDLHKIVKYFEVSNIGGNVFTQKLGATILANFEKRFGYALPQFKEKATKIAEDLKIELSTTEYASIDVIIDSELVNISIARQAFEESIKRDLDKGIDAIKKAVNELVSPIEAVVLTGGCMYIPCVKHRLKAVLENKKWYDNEPLSANAMGAVVFSGDVQKNIAPNTDEFSYQRSLVKHTAVNGMI